MSKVRIGDIGGDLTGNVAGDNIVIHTMDALEEFTGEIDLADAPEEVIEMVGEMEALEYAQESPSKEQINRWEEVVAKCIPHLVGTIPIVATYLTQVAL